jgi:hypothetical protein
MLLALGLTATLLSLLILLEVRRLRRTVDTQVVIARRALATTHVHLPEAVERAQTSAALARRKVAEILKERPEEKSGTPDANNNYLRWYHTYSVADHDRREAERYADLLLEGNAAVACAIKTADAVRTELANFEAGNLERVADRILRDHIYELVMRGQAVRCTDLLSGHRLFLRCADCGAEESTEVATLKEKGNVANACSNCGGDNCDSYIHADHIPFQFDVSIAAP